MESATVKSTFAIVLGIHEDINMLDSINSNECQRLPTFTECPLFLSAFNDDLLGRGTCCR